MKTIDMEIALSNYFNRRFNLIVPNVSWGMFNHECDLIIMTPAGYASEVEIKISKADLVRDKFKRHNHESHKIKYLYFAVPEFLKDVVEEHIPQRSGILIVKKTNTWVGVRQIKKPTCISNPYKFTDRDRYQLARLGALRIWTLKQNIINLKRLQDATNKTS